MGGAPVACPTEPNPPETSLDGRKEARLEPPAIQRAGEITGGEPCLSHSLLLKSKKKFCNSYGKRDMRHSPPWAPLFVRGKADGRAFPSSIRFP